MRNDATIWLPYTQMKTSLVPLPVASTHGSLITLTDGRQLIDGIASWWTACHGYNHPHLVEAIQQQATILPHIMLGGLIHPQAERLAHRLVALLPSDLKHVFFSDSGSVAIEIALKMALQFWFNQGEKQRHHFICFEHGYHGDTFFAMSVCDPHEGMHKLFHPVLPKQSLHPVPTTQDLLANLEAWLSKNHQQVAGLIIEPLVQGAGGMRMHTAATLKALAQLCQRFGILFIVDEIFTGFGRTGTLFAIDQTDIVPDIICLSKALTGGTLPLAVTITRQSVYDAFLGEEHEKALQHGSTFMGNALACAAANASLDLFASEPRLQQVAQIERFCLAELSSLQEVPGVKAVRIKGAIAAVQLAWPLEKELNWFKQQFIADGIWCRPFADIVYLTPAFTIPEACLAKLTASLSRQVRAWSQKFYQKQVGKFQRLLVS